MSFLGKILKSKKAADASKEKKEEKNIPEAREIRGEPHMTHPLVLGVLRGSHVTEKAASFAGARAYVFRVTTRANKPEVKKAVEARYGVHVEAVRMLAAHKKARMRGRIQGWKPGFRKAVVRVKEGEVIEMK